MVANPQNTNIPHLSSQIINILEKTYGSLSSYNVIINNMNNSNRSHYESCMDLTIINPAINSNKDEERDERDELKIRNYYTENGNSMQSTFQERDAKNIKFYKIPSHLLIIQDNKKKSSKLHVLTQEKEKPTLIIEVETKSNYTNNESNATFFSNSILNKESKKTKKSEIKTEEYYIQDNDLYKDFSFPSENNNNFNTNNMVKNNKMKIYLEEEHSIHTIESIQSLNDNKISQVSNNRESPKKERMIKFNIDENNKNSRKNLNSHIQDAILKEERDSKGSKNSKKVSFYSNFVKTIHNDSNSSLNNQKREQKEDFGFNDYSTNIKSEKTIIVKVLNTKNSASIYHHKIRKNKKQALFSNGLKVINQHSFILNDFKEKENSLMQLIENNFSINTNQQTHPPKLNNQFIYNNEDIVQNYNHNSNQNKEKKPEKKSKKSGCCVIF